MDVKMVDVLLHIDETLSHDKRVELEDSLRTVDGVMAVAGHDEKPHLLIIEYNPDVVSSGGLLAHAKESGVHAELVGL